MPCTHSLCPFMLRFTKEVREDDEVFCKLIEVKDEHTDRCYHNLEAKFFHKHKNLLLSNKSHIARIVRERAEKRLSNSPTVN